VAVCPTLALGARSRLPPRRCISYLTIEHDGPIPLEFRAAIGNRIYGCDDCQLVCPWNKFAHRSVVPDFDVREPLGHATLLQLWAWTEADFLQRTEGSAIRRIGWQRWRRNLAVGLGNAVRALESAIESAVASAVASTGEDALERGTDPPAGAATALRSALQQARGGADDLVREHIDWALAAAPPAP
jgi:epoxyqueuosine reductase